MKMMMQNQKVEKESQAYQAGGNITINNGHSFDEINKIVESLLKLNTPLIVQEASEEALKQVKEFIQEFLSGLKDEADIQRIQESLKKPRAQYLLKEGMENVARYGDTCDLNLLVNAIQKAMLEEDNEKVLLATSASTIIPQLHKKQISIISVMFCIYSISLPEDTIKPYPVLFLELLARQVVSIQPDNMTFSEAAKYHLITLGVCTFNQFAGGIAEDILTKRYPTTFSQEVLPLVQQGSDKARIIKLVIDCFNKNNLIQFNLTPVGVCIGYLIAKGLGTPLREQLFGQF